MLLPGFGRIIRPAGGMRKRSGKLEGPLALSLICFRVFDLHCAAA